MKHYTNLNTIDEIYSRSVLAIGTFDGLHRGHIHLLRKAKEISVSRNCPLVVFTFNNIPKISDDDSSHKLIFEESERASVLSELGVDCLVMIEFTPELKNTDKEDFIELLLKNFDPKTIVLGNDFRFGKGAEGSAEWLLASRSKFNIDVEVVDFLTHKGRKISSRDIRYELENGNIEEVNTMLGRNYFVKGIVIHGRKIGRKLGYKTANIDVGKSKRLPKNGVYVTKTTYRDTVYKSISNVGVKPTLDGKNILVETHLFDFDGDLYGEVLKVEFLEKIRDEEKFDSLDVLIERIERDVVLAREFFE